MPTIEAARLVCENCHPIIIGSTAPRRQPQRYDYRRLGDELESWAVVEECSGAIVTIGGERLSRLTKSEAACIAFVFETRVEIKAAGQCYGVDDDLAEKRKRSMS